jgi:hypothetical protein
MKNKILKLAAGVAFYAVMGLILSSVFAPAPELLQAAADLKRCDKAPKIAQFTPSSTAAQQIFEQLCSTCNMAGRQLLSLAYENASYSTNTVRISTFNTTDDAKGFPLWPGPNAAESRWPFGPNVPVWLFLSDDTFPAGKVTAIQCE